MQQASGIVRGGSDLLIVGDSEPGLVYRYPVPPVQPAAGQEPRLAVVEIDAAKTEKLYGGRLAFDLESIDLLPHGDFVALSEGAAALISRKAVLAEYPDPLMSIGGRGLEGLAVNGDGRIAVLWEGGFLSPNALPSGYPGVGELRRGPLKPLLCIHELPEPSALVVCRGTRGLVVLQVPPTPDPSQAFRAPDLVWGADGESFIVLLSSLNEETNSFRYKWLQRFSESGQPVGKPLNLCAPGYLPDSTRSGRAGNYEGLGWFELGKSVVLINDHTEAATAVVISVDPWPMTDGSIACDQNPSSR